MSVRRKPVVVGSLVSVPESREVGSRYLESSCAVRVEGPGGSKEE